MELRPKTIKIYLPEGSATGIKEAELTNRLVLAISAPRIKLPGLVKREAASYTGIYFLFGENEENSDSVVYIGQGENCLDRIKAHNRNKDFWNRCIIIVTKTNGFTRTDISYLEYYAILKTNELKRYVTDNQATPKKPSIKESDEADLLDSFETIKVLLSTLGYPIFEETRRIKTISQNIYYCKSKDADATGEYKDDGFVVLKGSKANIQETKTARPWVVSMRENLKSTGKLVISNNVLVFTSDHVFSSPSSAAATVLGRSANGWTSWKNKEDKTLDEVERK